MSRRRHNSNKWNLHTLGIGVGIGFVFGYLVAKKWSSQQDIAAYKRTKYRRFITGHDESGQSMIAISDSIPNHKEMKQFSIDVHNIWRCLDHQEANKDSCKNVKDLCVKLTKIPLSPNISGSNFRIVEFKPETTEYKALYNDDVKGSQDTIKNAWEDFGVECDGNVYDESNKKHPFMHRTQSIDYAICLYGEIILVLDKSETVIQAGDFVVQRATNHAWKNVSDDVCIICFVLIHSDKYQVEK